MDESGGFVGLDPSHLKFPDMSFIYSSTTANFSVGDGTQNGACTLWSAHRSDKAQFAVLCIFCWYCLVEMYLCGQQLQV